MPYVRVASPGMAASCPSPVAGAAASASGVRRGACPSVRQPLPAGDGLLARLRLAGRALTTDQAWAVADAAERHGSGVVELTSRANLQVRGVRPESLDGLVADLVAAGLVPEAPDDEPRADVVTTPGAGFVPDEGLDVRALADDLRLALAAGRLDRPLHPKAGVVLDGGGTIGTRGLPADVALGAVRRPNGELAYEVALGAALDEAPMADGGSLAPVVTPGCAVDLVVAVLSLAASPPPGAPSPGPDPVRVRELVAARGAHGVLSAAGVGHLVEWVDPAGLCRATPLAGGAPLGVHPGDDGHHAFVGALPPLGRLEGASLRALADALEARGGNWFVLTPRRSVLVPGMPLGQADALADDLSRLGFVLEAGDPAARIVACTGRPGCPSGHADTLADARHLVARLRTHGGVGPAVHVSGCGKRCAARPPHDATLEAGPDGYRLVLPTADGERVAADGLTADEAVAATVALAPTRTGAGLSGADGGTDDDARSER